LEICWRLAPLADAKYERSVEWMSTTIQPTIVSEWRARKTPCPLQLLLEVYRMPEDGDFHIIRLIRFLGREMKQKEIMFTLVQSEPLKQALEHALECAPRGRVLGNSLPTGMVVNPFMGDLIAEWIPYEWGREPGLAIRQLPASDELAPHVPRHRR